MEMTEMTKADSMSTIENEDFSSHEDTNSGSSKQDLDNASKMAQFDQIFDSEPEEDSFGSLALNTFPEDKIDPLSTHLPCNISKTTIENCCNKPIKPRSLSVQTHLNEPNTCNNCFINELYGANSRTFLGLQKELITITGKLKEKSKECETLNRENQQLNGMLQPGEQKSSFNWKWNYFSSDKKKNNLDANNFDIIQFRTEIRSLNQKLMDYENQVQGKSQEIIKYQEKIQQLKENFSKKTEIQKEILEEMDLKLRMIEEKLKVEKGLREKRESEISHIHSYLSKREHYYQNQIDEKASRLKQIEINHSQELKKIEKIIKQKDEELSQINENYNLILDKCNQQVEAINNNFLKEPLDEMFTLEKIKVSGLQQSVVLKTRLLNEAYMEIDALQKELNSKRQELKNTLSRLSERKSQEVVKQQLENIKEQINEVLNGIEQEASYCTSRFRDFTSFDLPKRFQPKLGDTEEVE